MAQLANLPERSLRLVQERMDSMDEDFANTLLLGLAVGATGMLLGIIIGMMTAPYSGFEIRSRLSQSVNRMGDGFQHVASDAVDELGELKSRAQDRVSELTSRIRRSG